MALSRGTIYAIVGIAGLAAIAALAIWYFTQKSGAGSGGGGGGSSGTTSCTFPVTVNSPPACITQAFKQSGYYDQVQQLVASGQEDATYAKTMDSDPSAWLHSHPYLYNAYPQYFSQG
jgi:hypothetical protein